MRAIVLADDESRPVRTCRGQGGISIMGYSAADHDQPTAESRDGDRILRPAASDDAPASFKFDQRGNDRWPMDGVATGFRLAGERFGEIFSFRMLDYSHCGMGAVSQTPIEPGSVISIGFQSPGHPAKRGTVASCRPCGDGYRVGIAFESRLAA